MSGAIATLSIDLIARLAALEEGMNKAGRLAEKNAAQIAGAYGALKGVAVAVGGALAAALAPAVITAFIKTTAEGVDKLNDLSDATGASIENLSALEDIAARTGTSIDTVGDAVVKMNKVLAEAKPGTDAANAIKALGLNVDELRRKDPAEALRALSVALTRFSDDGAKARIVQELFGKSVREVAPFLKDLADAGGLNATVTTEQAKQAEKFNQELAKLNKNSVDTARSITAYLVPAINKVFDAKNGKNGSSFSQLLGLDGLSEKVDQAVNAYRLIGLARERITPLQILEKDPTNAAALAELARIDARAKELAADLNRARTAYLGIGKGPDAGGGRGFVNPDDAASLPTIGSLPDEAARKKALEEYLAMVKAQTEGDEQAQKDRAEAWKAYEDIVLKDHKEGTEAWALQWKQVFDEIDAEQERAIEEGRVFVEQQVVQISEFAQQAARNIQDTLGDTLYAALDNKFSSIGDLWANLIKRMAAQAAAAQLNKYLFGSDFEKTGKVGGALGEFWTWLGTSSGGGSSSGVNLGSTSGSDLSLFFDGSHAAGLDYVPFDNYRAVLHRGERVKTAAAARDEDAMQTSARPPAQYIVQVMGDASENTLRLINGALANFEARQMRQAR